MTTPGSIGYPLLAAAATFFCATNSEKLKSKIAWFSVASLINSYAIFKAFNAPYFGAIVALGSCLVYYKGSNDIRSYTVIANMGVFLAASAKFFEILGK